MTSMKHKPSIAPSVVREQAQPRNKKQKGFFSDVPHGEVKIYTPEEIEEFTREREKRNSSPSQHQITKTIKAASRAGLKVKTIEISSNGKICLHSERASPLEQIDELDNELREWRNRQNNSKD